MELLIRVRDRGPAIDDSKAGDVIVVCPDGWAWSQAELTHPDWRIIQANVTDTEIAAWTSPERIPSTAPVNTKGKKRLFGLVLANLSLPAVKTFLANDARTVPVFKHPVVLGQLRAASIQRAASV